MDQLDPQYVREMLAILKEAGAAHFRCAEFSVAFVTEDEEQEEDEEMVTTDVRGFSAPSTDDDDDDAESMHRRAYGGLMPSLFPKRDK